MTIKEFIESDEFLKNMHYRTVYETITVLIGKGILSMDDFKSIKPVSADGFYKLN